MPLRQIPEDRLRARQMSHAKEEDHILVDRPSLYDILSRSMSMTDRSGDLPLLHVNEVWCGSVTCRHILRYTYIWRANASEVVQSSNPCSRNRSVNASGRYCSCLRCSRKCGACLLRTAFS